MKRDIWIFLFGMGMLLFGWPFLLIFKNNLILYLFVAWIIFIGLIYLASKYPKREDGGS